MTEVVYRRLFNPNHDPHSGEFAPGSGGGRGPVVAKGATTDEVAQNMGANELESGQDAHPERYMKHPKSGYMVEKPGVVFTESAPTKLDPNGSGHQPPRVRNVAHGEGFGPPPGYTQADVDSGKIKSLGYGKYQIGEERPPDHLFRAVSESDWQGIQAKGHMASDGRMNLAGSEGTVTSLTNPSYYLPGNLGSDKVGTVYQGRILRIKYRDADGWRMDGDGYVKTSAKVPLSQIDMISPLLQGTRGEYGADLQPVKSMGFRVDFVEREFYNKVHEKSSGRFGTRPGGPLPASFANQREACDWLKANYGIEGSLAGLESNPGDMAIAHDIVGGIKDVGDKYPETVDPKNIGHLRGIYTDGLGSNAAITKPGTPHGLSGSQIVFDIQNMRDVQAGRFGQKQLKGDTQWMVAKDVRGVTTHEMGHVYAASAGGGSKMGRVAAMMGLASAHAGGDQKALVPVNHNVSRVMNVFPSAYAHANDGELFAETFTAATNPKARAWFDQHGQGAQLNGMLAAYNHEANALGFGAIR